MRYKDQLVYLFLSTFLLASCGGAGGSSGKKLETVSIAFSADEAATGVPYRF